MVITGLTRNQFALTRTGVRIPLSPPYGFGFNRILFLLEVGDMKDLNSVHCNQQINYLTHEQIQLDMSNKELKAEPSDFPKSHDSAFLFKTIFFKYCR